MESNMKKTCMAAASFLLIILLTVQCVLAADIPFSKEGELQLEDYSEILLQADEVLVTEETIDSYLELMKQDLAEISGGTLPELSDSFISEYSEMYFGFPLDSVQAAREYIRGTLEESNKKNALIAALRDKATVLSYPEDVYQMASQYAADEIAYYALQEELEPDELAILSGYGSAEDYKMIQTDEYVKTAMLIDQILEKEGIVYQEEERDKALESYMQDLGYDAYTSPEEFKETAGETWLWLFTEFHYKSDLVYDALKDRIRIAE